MGKTIMYERIYADLLAKIQNGDYQPGDRLPSEKESAELYGADVLNYGSRHSYSFHSFRTFHRPDGSSFGLFSLADWYFAFLLYPDAIGKELVYQEVCTLAIAFGLFIPQIMYI